jgi:hypothetical protein
VLRHNASVATQKHRDFGFSYFSMAKWQLLKKYIFEMRANFFEKRENKYKYDIVLLGGGIEHV